MGRRVFFMVAAFSHGVLAQPVAPPAAPEGPGDPASPADPAAPADPEAEATPAAPAPAAAEQPEQAPAAAREVDAAGAGGATGTVLATESAADGGAGIAAEAPPEGRAPKGKRRSEVEVSGQLYLQYHWGTAQGVDPRLDDPDHELIMDSARFGVEWRRDPVTAQLEVELFEASSVELTDGSTSFQSGLEAKDAWVEYAPLKVLRVRAGQLKKPVSRLRTESRRSLPIISRGMVVGAMIDDAGYGGRDIGLVLGGRVGEDLRLRYEAGIFTGSGPNDREADANSTKDLAARLELDWQRWVTVGVDWSRQNQDPAASASSGGSLYGLDVGLDWEGIFGVVEGHVGRNLNRDGEVTMGGVIGFAGYRFALGGELELAPHIGSEFFDDDLSDPLRSLRQFLGLTFRVAKPLRLMLEVEQTATPLTQDSEAERALVFQVAFAG